jgi:hypothetical protein
MVPVGEGLSHPHSERVGSCRRRPSRTAGPVAHYRIAREPAEDYRRACELAHLTFLCAVGAPREESHRVCLGLLRGEDMQCATWLPVAGGPCTAL